MLLPWGVGIRPADATVDDESVTVRFGFFGTTVLLADVERFEISGPFIWLRALAVRHTVFKTDISYCTDGRGAVRLFLKTPRRVHWARRVDQVYVGIEDLEGLADELRARGIPGEDRRRSKAPAGA
ncbi:MAG: hypothetical protein QOH61_1916 [Chloroflexota bacterium]|nr:hypothetical protein [Chloroflexota bacterium]